MENLLIVDTPHHKRYATAYDERFGDYVLRWKDFIDGKWEYFARLMPEDFYHWEQDYLIDFISGVREEDPSL